MILNLFVKLKYQSSTIILAVGIKYSVHDLLCEVNYYAWPANLQYSYGNDVSPPSGINSHWQDV